MEREVHILTDREVELSARILIAEYGEEASERAKERVTETRAAANHASARAWGRILAATMEQQARKAV